MARGARMSAVWKRVLETEPREVGRADSVAPGRPWSQGLGPDRVCDLRCDFDRNSCSHIEGVWNLATL